MSAPARRMAKRISKAHTCIRLRMRHIGFAKRTAMPFAPSLRDKLLLWCDRHCCLCKKACDAFIEAHHIDPVGGDDEDNAIPLCFDCHGKVSHYDVKQSIGTKFKSDELKKRREQVYKQFTRQLVPALNYKVQQLLPNGARRALPDVGFSIVHLGDAPPVQALVTLDNYVDGRLANIREIDPLYRGGLRWNLNPKEGANGHFPISNAACQGERDIRVGVNITVFDCYDRAHALLPVTYVYSRSGNEWWLDPIDPVASAERVLSRTS
ncbi:MAG: HNH endonuclease [Hyphomicrobiaceae bacterium]